MNFPPLRLFAIAIYVGLSAYACSQLNGDAGDDAPGGGYAAAEDSCVIDVPEDAVCTGDLNACGFGSVCGCPEGYGYNAALGKCVMDLAGVISATPAQLYETSCVRKPAGICTRDINMCGQPSSCACEEGFQWNDVAGMCIKVLE